MAAGERDGVIPLSQPQIPVLLCQNSLYGLNQRHDADSSIVLAPDLQPGELHGMSTAALESSGDRLYHPPVLIRLAMSILNGLGYNLLDRACLDAGNTNSVSNNICLSSISPKQLQDPVLINAGNSQAVSLERIHVVLRYERAAMEQSAELKKKMEYEGTGRIQPG